MTTPQKTALWTEWPHFDEEGETGRTIIGDNEGRAIFCTCLATEAEKNMAKAAPRLLRAAARVVANWERGDLAHAVRELDAAIRTAEGRQ